jgi:hypothetical protein
LTGVTEWNLVGGYDTKSHRGRTHPKEGRAMTAQAPELAAVVARLEKVEQQNRKLKTVGVVVLALGCCWDGNGIGNAESADSGGGGVCP